MSVMGSHCLTGLALLCALCQHEIVGKESYSDDCAPNHFRGCRHRSSLFSRSGGRTIEKNTEWPLLVLSLSFSRVIFGVDSMQWSICLYMFCAKGSFTGTIVANNSDKTVVVLVMKFARSPFHHNGCGGLPEPPRHVILR